ncbi:MAG: hypothetical protein V1734_06175 [Nanoarchaeota archaeon]
MNNQDSIQYSTTNESLQAIVEGMDLSRDDDVLAVLGSGDQAIAMAEYANSVTAYDLNPGQVQHARYKIRLINQGRFDEFINAGNLWSKTKKARRDAYFGVSGRLERIREKAEQIKLKAGKLRAPKKGLFSKAYLSNILGYGMAEAPWLRTRLFLGRLAKRLRAPGLIYIANGDRIDRQFLFQMDYIPGNLMIDEKLTKQARDIEIKWWQPLVLMRKA